MASSQQSSTRKKVSAGLSAQTGVESVPQLLPDAFRDVGGHLEAPSLHLGRNEAAALKRLPRCGSDTLPDVSFKVTV